MLPINLHPDAEEEVAEAFAYLREHAGQLVAERYWNQLVDVAAAILENPERFPKYRADTRKALFAKYPYAVIYEIMQDGFPFIWAVPHQRRKPGYWTPRKQT